MTPMVSSFPLIQATHMPLIACASVMKPVPKLKKTPLVSTKHGVRVHPSYLPKQLTCLLIFVPATVFFRAKSLISPYFVESDPLNTVEGKPRNASNESHLSVVAMLLGFTSMMF